MGQCHAVGNKGNFHFKIDQKCSVFDVFKERDDLYGDLYLLIKIDEILLIRQTEERLLPDFQQPYILLAEGSLSAVKHQIPLIESVFNKYGVDVKFHVSDGVHNTAQHRKLREVGDLYDSIGWSILLCLNNSSPTEPCYDMADRLFLKQHQRVNVIPELQEKIQDIQSLCFTTSTSQTGKWLNNSGLDCAVFPDKENKLSIKCQNQSVYMMDKMSSQSRLLPCQHLYNNRAADPVKTSSVGILLPENLYHLNDEPLVAMFNILVMSFSPLRVYLHPQGQAWDGFTAFIDRKPLRTLTISELQSVISDLKGYDHSRVIINQLQDLIVTTLMNLEALHWLNNNRIRCPTCFQWLEMVTVFNTTFHPFILQIRSSSHHGKQSSLNEYLVHQKILDNLAAMLVSKTTVTMDVGKGLHELGLTQILGNQQVCNKERSVCLMEDDLHFILKNRQEHINMGNFIKLYPLTTSVKYTKILKSLYTDINNTSESFEPWAQQPHSTLYLHSVLLSLERFYANVDKEDRIERYDDMNIPIDSKQPVKDGVVKIVEKSEEKLPIRRIEDNFTKPPCDKDPSSMPYLGHLSTVPPVELEPEFSPFLTDYTATVGYNTLLMKVMAFAKSCSSQARLEDKQGDSGISNITLGIGENKIWIFIVDTSHSDTWVVNTYTILITRHGPDIPQPFIPTQYYQICSLKQDCSLPFSMWDACGLQQVNSRSSWSQFIENLQSSLPTCSTGSAPGEWYVPCNQCRNESSCFWNKARWQPYSCQHPVMERDSLKQCFIDKKVLFIGDSTNRGILHYVTEQVNGTLLEWDKTHNLKVYSNLNDNQTMFSFAYYPQFWLPAEHRPVFDKALYQLMKRSMPLQNNSNTVLVIGGVHWLGKHHIDVVNKALNREGLTGIRLVIKGLGAGFHQPVSGVHCLTQSDHEKLLNHNRVLLDYASKNRYHVIDTFNMTMARYKDFLQGKCACHFHRVSLVKENTKTRHSVDQPQYHVEGEINAVYSEMTINEICRPG
ncbi:hypothetical protein LOTGIDRAFT_174209 [Lottia gigantea]|uniref:Cadherin-like beta sandwich domain-containing protein n=1 Tax=Lottia gigantea TaxID=225164 RepID=V4A3Q3_LOTGI|nr:hypothetical protein LOTGIDRAFT_174209 [Lottia gigantea]ESO98523.1 hypothetical protein LOTGIDRAFT_174209 [Lottia gigantea]